MLTYHESAGGVANSVYTYTFAIEITYFKYIPLLTIIEYNEENIKDKVKEKEFFEKHWKYFITNFHKNVIDNCIRNDFIEKWGVSPPDRYDITNSIGKLGFSSKDILCLMLGLKTKNVKMIELKKIKKKGVKK